MKNHMPFIIAVGVVLALNGCSHEQQLLMSGAKILNHAELEQLFYTSRMVKFSSLNGSATVKYYPDGLQEIEWDNGKDTGRFRIEDGEFCSTWKNLRKGAESCLKAYKVSENGYELIDSDGALAATMHLN